MKIWKDLEDNIPFIVAGLHPPFGDVAAAGIPYENNRTIVHVSPHRMPSIPFLDIVKIRSDYLGGWSVFFLVLVVKSDLHVGFGLSDFVHHHRDPTSILVGVGSPPRTNDEINPCVFKRIDMRLNDGWIRVGVQTKIWYEMDLLAVDLPSLGIPLCWNSCGCKLAQVELIYQQKFEPVMVVYSLDSRTFLGLEIPSSSLGVQNRLRAESPPTKLQDFLRQRQCGHHHPQQVLRQHGHMFDLSRWPGCCLYGQ